MHNENWKIETKAVQEGYTPKNGEPRVLPIYQSTTYKYDTAEEVAKLFDLEAEGHMYSRISNPTVEALENKMAALEGGVGGLAAASGQTATMIAMLTICCAGDHIVSASTVYGGTHSLFYTTFKKIGIDVTFVDPAASAKEIEGVFQENTKALFGETIGNPGLNVLDFEKFSSVAHKMQVPFIVDNTFGTPYLCRPLEHGADIVLHSCTKYIDGHAGGVGGMIIDGGSFNWENGKYTDFVEPDPSYHGVRYVERFGKLAYITKARVQLIRDTGAYLSPFNAYMMNLGLETLHLRMERHCENAQKVAKFLKEHPSVQWVNYPGMPNHPTYHLGQRYLPKGCSGVLTFGIKGGKEAGITFINNLKWIAMVVHVADARTCVLHPASMTHRQLTEEQQIAAGVTPDMIRFSVGIENCDDIIEDLDQALNSVKN